MKKFLRNNLLFFTAIIIIDVLFGVAFQYMYDHSKGGNIKRSYYICKLSAEDIYVFGSSRAFHHYVPDIIEDSLSLSCYNTGNDGSGIITNFGYLKLITERHTPKLIIYDVSWYDFTVDDNIKYLDELKPFYYELGIDSIFWKVEPKTRSEMLSNLYRFNTTCLRVLVNYIHPFSDYHKGYSPYFVGMNYEPEISDLVGERTQVDSLKMWYFEEFVKLAKSKEIKMVCFVSPLYKASKDDRGYAPIRQICERNNIPFYYLSAMTEVYDKRKCFRDRKHMNDIGARLYTSFIASELKSLGIIDSLIQRVD